MMPSSWFELSVRKFCSADQFLITRTLGETSFSDYAQHAFVQDKHKHIALYQIVAPLKNALKNENAKKIQRPCIIT